MKRALLLVLAAAGALALGACNLNDYCVGSGCEPGGGGDGGDDGGTIDANSDSGVPPDACVANGAEVCDGIDNDCNGAIDDNVPEVGQNCGVNVGQCTVGTYSCTGGELVCSGVAASPEECDNIDNNCNGQVDEGNPEGGATCGSDVGECVAGVTTCLPGGILDCVGDSGTPGTVAEICDGKDNDCDGSFDEDVPTQGDCGFPATGECVPGTLTCVGGQYLCVGGQGPTFDACNALDEDCDGNPTNNFDLQNDTHNCGTCNHDCTGTINNATARCTGGNCVIASCDPGFFDDPTHPGPDCDYPCNYLGPNEACNNLDDDCDFNVDEDVTAPGFCNTTGECAGATATCVAGVLGCSYPSTVSTDSSGSIIPEFQCDGLDNDCDGVADDSFPTLGQSCFGGTDQGVCQDTGHIQCQADPLAAPTCVIDNTGGTASAEICDDKDNDCDGNTDENPGTLQNWIDIGGGHSIMKYEASRPDAATTNSDGSHVCSNPDVLPWTQVTQPEADAACRAIGARLCTEQEWHRACSAVAGTTYPVSEPATGNGYMFFEAEDYFTRSTGTSGGTTRAWVPDYTTPYSGISALRASPNTGADLGTLATLAASPGVSPRLDFEVNFQTTGTHYVYVHMYRNATADNIVHLGINRVFGITSVSRATNVVTVTTSAAHGFTVGAQVVLAGVTDTGFNGTFTIATVPTSTTFTFAQTAANAVSSGGTTFASPSFTISTAARAGGTATITTTAAHDYAVGETVTIAGCTQAAFNGTWVVTAVPSATQFRFALSGSTGGTGGTATAKLPTAAASAGASLAWEWDVAGPFQVGATGNRDVSLWMGRDGVRVDAIVVTQVNTTTPSETRLPGGTWSIQPDPLTFASTTCNGQENGAGAILATHSKLQCNAADTGGATFDLSGNVKEWTEERIPNENPIRGGAYNNLQGGTTCANAFSLADDSFAFNNVGFRCCK